MTNSSCPNLEYSRKPVIGKPLYRKPLNREKNSNDFDSMRISYKNLTVVKLITGFLLYYMTQQTKELIPLLLNLLFNKKNF